MDDVELGGRGEGSRGDRITLHHAEVLENWGVLWMWHSLVLFFVCSLTNVLFLLGYDHPDDRWIYFLLWTAGLGTWAAVFWALRRRMGPVT